MLFIPDIDRPAMPSLSDAKGDGCGYQAMAACGLLGRLVGG